MPIKPENRKRYPANWKDIRKDILKRADNKCELCQRCHNRYDAKHRAETRRKAGRVDEN